MTTFRLRRPNFSIFILPISLLKRPFLILLFFFFLTSSSDLLHAPLLLFKVKLTNAIAVLLFCAFFIARAMQISKQFFSLILAILGCMTISLLNSPHLVTSIGFIVFFLFTYLVYFLIPYNQFRSSPADTLLKIYFGSFYCTGIYALCQMLFSFAGVKLPGVTQYISYMARGSAFAYEPSFYALYMTPFTIYCTVKFMLQDPAERKIRQVFWPNVFLLASTSTGCFFSYLFFLFFIIVFNYFKIIQLSTKKLIANFLITCLGASAFLGILNKELLIRGFLKFFYKGGLSHHSIRERWEGLTDYWDIFLEHPIIGVSLGGGPFYRGQKKGVHFLDLLSDPNTLGSYCPMNATTEILASLGILGSIFFLCFFYILFNISRSTLRIPILTKEEKMTFIAFALSICVMFMTLQFNQSIMRAYMWIHIGIFCGYARHLKEKYQ